MNRIARRSLSLLAVFLGGLVLASCGGGGTPEPVRRTFAYVANDDSGDVSIFRVDDEGEGALHPVGRVAAAPGTLTVTVHPQGRFAYAVNTASDSITTFRVDPATGMLAASGSAATGRAPFLLQFHPSGRYAFLTISTDGVVATYDVDPESGVLTLRTTTPVGERSTGMAIHPSGKFLYVEGGAQLFAFAIRDNGELSLINAVATEATPEGVFMNPSIGFVHVMNNLGLATSHAIDPTTGAVSAAASTMNDIGAFSVRSTALDSTGRFAYIADPSGESVRVFAIDAVTGALTHVRTLPTGPYPLSLALSPSGRFVYVPNSQDDTVSSFRVDPATGLLSTMGQPVPAGERPFSITMASFLH